jgi:hypothetical protein
MRLSAIIFGLVLICAVIGLAVPPQPQDEGDVRGAFLTSRPKEKPATSTTTTRPSRRRPKSTATPSPTPVKTVDNKPPGGRTGGTKPSKPDSKPVNARRIGLGMTLFSRDTNGLAVRVDPDHVFRKGDRVRILLETNTDGYLYIFNRTGDAPAVMIYPDAELDEGGNYLQAHVPFEIPAADAPEERLRWFAFDDVGGTEHVFFVFTREPLKDVPIEDALVAYCKDNKCPWRPADEVWEHVQKQSQELLKTDRTKNYGKAQTNAEHDASTRGLGLAKDDPEPSVIMMASSTSPFLVAILDLIHK